MRILALDASSVSCSACVAENDKITASVYMRNGLTHSATLLPAVQKVLADSGLTATDIDRVCLTVGPGSFTGIKIAVATAKGLCFARNIKTVGVSTLEALAYNAEIEDGVVCPVMDARRNMFYNALFRFDNGKMTRLCPDRQISAADLAEEISGLNVCLVGDGSPLFKNFCVQNMIAAYTVCDSRTYIHAESIVAAVAAGCGTEQSADKLVPIYLRPSQAERERAEKLKRSE